MLGKCSLSQALLLSLLFASACSNTTSGNDGAGIGADVIASADADTAVIDDRIRCDSDVVCQTVFNELAACEGASCVEGYCAIVTLDDGTPCADGYKCTGPDACINGQCRGNPLSCDDGNPCTADKCDAKNGCYSIALRGDACDDGNPCTVGDACADSLCVPGPVQEGCCQFNGECDDGEVCTDDTCDQGTCAFTPNYAPCEDDNPCTLQDTCDGAGSCVGSEIPCEDGSPCTADSCDPATGSCQSSPAPDGTACDDANPCTTLDVCEGGGCVGKNDICECTTDADCVPFEDGDLCNGTLICTGFTCVVDLSSTITCPPTPFPCAPGVCQPATGQCVPTPVADGTLCDDADPCTGVDICTVGVCSGPNLDCDDGNICTLDACNPASGCENLPTVGACSDGDACTLNDACSQGSCVPGPFKECDDGNVCTDDSCNSDTGNCSASPNNASCDDGNECTEGDTCGGGVCVGGANVCECQTDADCIPQEDGNLCNGTLRCINFSCEVDPTTVVTCDSGSDEACRANTCQPATGLCALTPVADDSPCLDNDLCNGSETCSNGTCVGGSPLNCDDGNPCTDDGCTPGTGCANSAVVNGTACPDDGDECTADECASGVCVHTYNCAGVPPTVTCGADITAEPLDTVQLTGTGTDPDGGNVAFLWEIISAPTGSTAQPAAPGSANTSLYLDLAGTYQVQLTVTDDEGETATCVITITAIPPQALRFELVWDTQYGDADLILAAPYVANPADAWFHPDDACWYGNTNAKWAPNGPDGDASLDLDDTDGYGPENINVDVNPADGDYRVAVNYYCSRSIAKNGPPGQLAPGDGPTEATVRIFCAGNLVSEITKISLDQTGRFVDVATVNWPSCDVQIHKNSDWVANVQPAAYSSPIHCLTPCEQDNDCPGPEVCNAINYCDVP